MRMASRIPLFVVPLAILLTLTSGCGEQRPRYPLAGKVTFRGNPVPFGRLTLIPESPDMDPRDLRLRSIVDFHEGEYETPPGQYVFGGKYRVEIDGFRDTEAEMRMFPICSMHVTLPEAGGTFDIDVPARPNAP